MNSLKKFLLHYGLLLVLTGLFLGSLLGHVIFGFYAVNEERIEKGLPPLMSIISFLGNGEFLGTLGENWESEFLQMALFVCLTAFLYQKGSPESKTPPDEESEKEKKETREEEDYSRRQRQKHPILWRLYECSLTLSLGFLFIISLVLHLYGFTLDENETRARSGASPVGMLESLTESKFWFESFQNWQSEFFSIAVMGLLGVYLRQKHSPQSKKMQDPHWKTGTE